jgi:hypothetical protein
MRDLALGNCNARKCNFGRGGLTCAVMKKKGVIVMEMEGTIVIHDNM